LVQLNPAILKLSGRSSNLSFGEGIWAEKLRSRWAFEDEVFVAGDGGWFTSIITGEISHRLRREADSLPLSKSEPTWILTVGIGTLVAEQLAHFWSFP
jgi:hypothetical protein